MCTKSKVGKSGVRSIKKRLFHLLHQMRWLVDNDAWIIQFVVIPSSAHPAGASFHGSVEAVVGAAKETCMLRREPAQRTMGMAHKECGGHVSAQTCQEQHDLCMIGVVGEQSKRLAGSCGGDDIDDAKVGYGLVCFHARDVRHQPKCKMIGV